MDIYGQATEVARPGSEDQSLRSPRMALAVEEQTNVDDLDYLPGVEDSRVFAAFIARGDRKLMADVNFHDNTTLLVIRVKPGPADDYNKENPGNEIGPGDRIVSVNGVIGDTQKMVNACKDDPELKMMVRRCEEITIKLAKRTKDHVLGLDVSLCDTMSLVVSRVVEDDYSLAAEHNRRAPDFGIEKDFRVMEVNGVRGDVDKMMEAILGGNAWEIVFRQVWPK